MDNIDNYGHNPDILLNSMETKNTNKDQGKLRIFFGMAAGVGKTYQMLESAKSEKNEGKDIVIGYIEPRQRIETEKLLEGFEIIPRAVFHYHSIILEDTDIDAILKRKPEIVLIDELAHTNVRGCRNKKRYQDILELLESGIDVWTTLNVQNLESRASTVEQITGIKIHETVPDSILEQANKIELIDLAPEDLRKRLKDGKIYSLEKASIELNNFFQKSYLTALREIALQVTAKLVDAELNNYLKSKNINTLWKTNEKLISAISASPYSEYIIRWTKRIAFNLKAEWYAVNIDTGTFLTDEQQKNLEKNIKLARELGAEVVITSDEDIVSGIIRIARQKKATQIITGKPLFKSFKDIFKGSIPERIIKQSGDIDVYAVSEPGAFNKAKVNFLNFKIKPGVNLFEIITACISLAGITLFNLMILKLINYWAASLIFLTYVIFISLFTTKMCALLTAALTATIWNYFFIPPRFTFYIDKIEDIFMFVLFFIVAFITVNLSAKIRLKESFLYKRERTLSEVFELSKLLNNIISISDLKIISEDFLSKIFKSETELIFDSKNANDADKAIIEWVKTNKKPAGRFTNTFFKNDYYYYPIVCVNNESGVIKFKFTNEESLSFEKENLIQTFAIMISGIADRIFTIEKSKKNAVENESQKLFSIILKSISHELRTPLTSLSLCVNGLIDEAILHNYESRNMLITDIRESVVRLNRVVGNLLNMARLESGNLSLHLKEYDIVDLINSVLIKHESELKGYTVVTEFSDNMPLIKIDFNLFEQVISNILINAVYYNDCGITIKISVFDEKQNINIIISDDGRGLKNPEKIFNKFYREQPDKTGGLGLGLTICKEIIEMHNGIITAESKTGCGAEFKIIIPFTGGKI